MNITLFAIEDWERETFEALEEQHRPVCFALLPGISHRLIDTLEHARIGDFPSAVQSMLDVIHDSIAAFADGEPQNIVSADDARQSI